MNARCGKKGQVAASRYPFTTILAKATGTHLLIQNIPHAMTPLAQRLQSIARGHCLRVAAYGGPATLQKLPPRSQLVRSASVAARPDVEIARLMRVEAVLFLAREPLSYRRLAQLANLIDATEARTLVSQLIRRYNERGRAFQIEQVAGGVQLLSRPPFAPWIAKLRPVTDTPRADWKLSAPALDTLTVVAYRQPVLRVELEAIRGVGCGELLRQLIERDLLRIVGRSEELGRPLQYGTTKRFLEVFGLKSLGDLPAIGDLPLPATPSSNTRSSQSGNSHVQQKAA